MERKSVLESLTFLTEKRDNSIKVRHCANGKPQRIYKQQDDVSSPTVATESVLLTAGIEAKEGRDVMTIDVPNTFLQTSMDEVDEDGNQTIMRIRGALVDILCDIDPSCEECVVEEKGVHTLYVHILKALYGLLVPSMLFYRKLSKDLVEAGFVINPHDPCVANKMVDGKQHTVCWHVDDLKSSHKDSRVNDAFAKWIEEMCGTIGKVKVIQGKVYDYLGMILDYSVPGRVTIDVSDYVKAMIKEFPEEELVGPAPKSPWNDNLFKVDPNSLPLSVEKKELFHRVTAQGPFVTKRGRPDIAPSIAFKTTRVTCSTKEDWAKLRWLLMFLKATADDKLTWNSTILGSYSGIPM